VATSTFRERFRRQRKKISDRSVNSGKTQETEEEPNCPTGKRGKGMIDKRNESEGENSVAPTEGRGSSRLNLKKATGDGQVQKIRRAESERHNQKQLGKTLVFAWSERRRRRGENTVQRKNGKNGFALIKKKPPVLGRKKKS